MTHEPPIANGRNRDSQGRTYARDLRGRFRIGTRGGPGSPRNAQVARLRAVVLEVVTVGEMFDLSRRLLAQAKAGDVNAARLVLEFALGKPRKSPRAPGGSGRRGTPSRI